MQFQDFSTLVTALQSHEPYKHEIKIKRLRKEMQMLEKYKNEEISIQKIMLTSIGIQVYMKNIHKKRTYRYKLLLDVEYPFNRPQIHYLNKEHPMGKCKDLLGIVLQEGKNWGPSLMLTAFLDRLDQISERIHENLMTFSTTVNGVSDLSNGSNSGTYHRYEIYSRTDLKESGVELFSRMNEFTWKYLLKSTHPRVMGLTEEAVLIFQPEGKKPLLSKLSNSSTGSSFVNSQVHPINGDQIERAINDTENNLRLIWWKPICEISTVNASVSNGGKKFNLEITYPNPQSSNQQNKNETLYFGGSDNIQSILRFLNPIEMIERNINSDFQNKSENDSHISEEQIIKDYSQLIEYYSVNDPQKAEKYVKEMKNLIESKYKQPSKQESGNVAQQSEIHSISENKTKVCNGQKQENISENQSQMVKQERSDVSQGQEKQDSESQQKSKNSSQNSDHEQNQIDKERQDQSQGKSEQTEKSEKGGSKDE